MKEIKKRGFHQIVILIFCFVLMIILSFSAKSLEIIIDNNDGRYSDIGSWSNSVNSCGFNGDYRFESSSNETEKARWTPNITINGTYDIYIHYCVHSARPQSVKYKISHAAGNTYLEINQTQNASGVIVSDFTPSGFRFLGRFPFTSSMGQYVELNTSSPGETSADAIMFSTGPYITNKSVSSICVFQNDSIELFANISSPLCIGNVTFSIIYQNNTIQNISGILNTDILTIERGNYKITLSDLPSSESINWTVFADDCFNNTVKNGLESFYVNSKTVLNVTPSSPDGLNNWYTLEPIFTLMNLDASSIFYKWDAQSARNYSAPFNLAEAPNNGSITGGINILHYWTNASCGFESDNNITIKADFRNPLITNLNPANSSIVYNNLRPIISSLLTDIFGSNSGIDQTNISVFVDGSNVSFDINQTSNLSSINLIISYIPLFNLSLGLHNVTINVSDNAGRNSQLTWFFSINLTSQVNISVYSPTNNSYSTKNVPFNITTSTLVSNITFINYNDKNPRFNVLCKNCNQYGFSRKQTRLMNEGQNNLTIRVTDYSNQMVEMKASFFVDSKLPVVLSISPIRNAVINGSFFFIKYSENNLKNITLIFNQSIEFLGCPTGINKNCSMSVNLTAFDSQFIDFYFNLSDIVRTTTSKKTRVKVDTTSPNLIVHKPINNITFNITKIQFNISISEPSTLEFIDLNQSLSRFRTLCINCNNFGLTSIKTVTFTKGNHSIIIRARDKAGNSASESVNISII